MKSITPKIKYKFNVDDFEVPELDFSVKEPSSGFERIIIYTSIKNKKRNERRNRPDTKLF